MKIFKKIITVVVVILTVRIFFVPNIGQKLSSQLSDFNSLLAGQVAKSMTKSAVKEDNTNKLSSDGIERVSQGRRLDNNYYYHFTNDVPDNFKKVFKEAIARYNQTGIVKLTPGDADGKGNELVLSVYYKQKRGNSLLEELGVGGPRIYPRMGLNGYDLNSGQAKLNAQYSPRLSVALHEIGHALGLDHSKLPNSIMYPLDQGRTTFSKQDLQTLEKIYSHDN